MKTCLLILCAVGFCFGAYAAGDVRNGVWTAELRDDDRSSLQMTMFYGKEREGSGHWGRGGMSNIMGVDVPLASATGLTAADLSAAAANVQFTIARPAGTIHFEGRFANGTGAGSYRFTPNEAFVREMDSLGYKDFSDSDLLVFAAHDFAPQTIRDLRSLGYEPSRQQVLEIAIFRITANVVREYARLGYSNLTFRELVNFRVGRVDAAYIAGMREAGYTDLPAQKLANLAILGVTPAYVRDLKAAGLADLSARDAENLRIGGITPKRIDEYRRLGYTLTLRELGDFGIHGVTAQFIEELRGLGYANIPARQLIEMKIFGVTPDYIRKMERAGYRNVPVEKLIKLKMSGADKLLVK